MLDKPHKKLKIETAAPVESSAVKKRPVVIQPPQFESAVVLIRGTVPYVQNAFGQKAREQMIERQKLGSVANKNRTRAPKDFEAAYEAAKHVSHEGWPGIPAGAFRNAMISACRTVGFKMTIAKLSVFVDGDGFDSKDDTPLVRITKGEARPHFATARNDNGSTDVRCRPLFDPGWEAELRLTWDAEQFSASDVVNLLARVGRQVGIGEGWHDSRNSAGLGWGSFAVIS